MRVFVSLPSSPFISFSLFPCLHCSLSLLWCVVLLRCFVLALWCALELDNVQVLPASTSLQDHFPAEAR